MLQGVDLAYICGSDCLWFSLFDYGRLTYDCDAGCRTA